MFQTIAHMIYLAIAVTVSAIQALRWASGMGFMGQLFESFGYLTMAGVFIVMMCIFGVAYMLFRGVLESARTLMIR